MTGMESMDADADAIPGRTEEDEPLPTPILDVRKFRRFKRRSKLDERAEPGIGSNERACSFPRDRFVAGSSN